MSMTRHLVSCLFVCSVCLFVIESIALRSFIVSGAMNSSKLWSDFMVYVAREGDSHLKGTGMLVVSIRGVNFGFWSRLGCSGQNVSIFRRQGLV